MKINHKKNKKKLLNILKKQLVNVLDKKFNKRKIIIAYEPIWSIGTGIIPNNNELRQTLIFIKKF